MLVDGVHRSINSDFARGPPGPQFLCSGGATGPPCAAFISGSWVMIRPLSPVSVAGGALARHRSVLAASFIRATQRAWGWRAASRSLARASREANPLYAHERPRLGGAAGNRTRCKNHADFQKRRV